MTDNVSNGTTKEIVTEIFVRLERIDGNVRHNGDHLGKINGSLKEHAEKLEGLKDADAASAVEVEKLSTRQSVLWAGGAAGVSALLLWLLERILNLL